jgi:uncharacterized metal-binding protein
MEKSSCGCSCSKSPTVVFPCSGAADVGELSDRTARQLTNDGIGKMFCLAGIGGGVSGIVESTRSAEKILVIDGCPLDCAKKTMEKAGLTSFKHTRITDMGFKKGHTEVSAATIEKAVDNCKAFICS